MAISPRTSNDAFRLRLACALFIGRDLRNQLAAVTGVAQFLSISSIAILANAGRVGAIFLPATLPFGIGAFLITFVRYRVEAKASRFVQGLDDISAPEWVPDSLLAELRLEELEWKRSDLVYAMATRIRNKPAVCFSSLLEGRFTKDPKHRIPVYHELGHLFFRDEVSNEFTRQLLKVLPWIGLSSIVTMVIAFALFGQSPGSAGQEVFYAMTGSGLLSLGLTIYLGFLLDRGNRGAEHGADLFAVTVSDRDESDLKTTLPDDVGPAHRSRRWTGYPTKQERVETCRLLRERVERMATEFRDLEVTGTAADIERQIRKAIYREKAKWPFLAGLALLGAVLVMQFMTVEIPFLRETFLLALFLAGVVPIWLRRVVHRGFTTVAMFLAGVLVLIEFGNDPIKGNRIATAGLFFGVALTVMGMFGMFIFMGQQPNDRSVPPTPKPKA